MPLAPPTALAPTKPFAAPDLGSPQGKEPRATANLGLRIKPPPRGGECCGRILGPQAGALSKRGQSAAATARSVGF